MIVRMELLAIALWLVPAIGVSPPETIRVAGARNDRMGIESPGIP